ncbi:tRNA modification GTPase TrmE, partial [Mycoplasmopsis synoviae]
MVVTNKILELLISNGARLAEPGEFTRRAFLNGKLDLSKADAIHNLIMSKTRLQARNEASKLKGSASKVIKDLLKELSLLIGSIEVGIDYPEYIDDYEEDLKANSKEDINLTRINKLIARLEKIVKSSETALNYFEGIKLAIVGKPNVGKSSLLNAMLKEDKAIVTNVAGTTRDIVEGIYYLDNFIFKIIDTAGIRKTRQEIEKIGIERSYKAILDADIVLHLFDNLNSEDEFDLDIKKIVQENNKNYIKVVNKSDLKSDIKW